MSETKEVHSVFVHWFNPPVLDVDPLSEKWVTITLYKNGTVELDMERPPEDEIIKRIPSYEREARAIRNYV